MHSIGRRIAATSLAIALAVPSLLTLSCTNSERPDAPRFRVTIGSGGGQLTVGNGSVQLTVPPGALDGDRTISLALGRFTAIEGWNQVGAAYEFAPTDLLFALPTELILPFLPGQVSPIVDPSTELRIGWRDAAGAVAILTPSFVDSNRVTVTALRLGTFWPIAPDVVSGGALFPLNDTDTYRFESGLELTVARTATEPNLQPRSVAKATFAGDGASFGLYLDDSNEQLHALGEFDGVDYQEVLGAAVLWVDSRNAVPMTRRSVSTFDGFAPYGTSPATYQGVADTTITLAERVSLTTPAGVFPAVRITIASRFTTTQPQSGERFLELWLAERVGPVAIRIGNAAQPDLLLGATVAGLPIGGS